VTLGEHSRRLGVPGGPERERLVAVLLQGEQPGQQRAPGAAAPELGMDDQAAGRVEQLPVADQPLAVVGAQMVNAVP
jgi:hypothetical protein